MPIPDHYPATVSACLTALLEELDAKLGTGYCAAVYGSLARNRYEPDRSDVNLALVVNDISIATLQAIRDAIRNARRLGRVEVLLLEARELPRIVDSFTDKLLHIQRHHDMLRGPDPFLEIVIPFANVRLQLEQRLRNHSMRLRRLYLRESDYPFGMAQGLRNFTRQLWPELESVLFLLKEPEPSQRCSLLEVLAERVGLDIGALRRLDESSRMDELGDLEAHFSDLLTVVETTTRFVDALG